MSTITEQRALDLYRTRHDENARRTDRTFAGLLIGQWVFASGIALILSPLAWEGRTSSTHPHVWAALGLGGLINALPLILVLSRPGAPITRHVIAVAQMLWSALLIHLTGGRIETHFHVFGSLAFLSFYRDWRVLVPATVVVAGDHLLRQMFWPESVFGISTPESWRFAEHAAWVVFEDVFLVLACVRADRESRDLARVQAQEELVALQALLARDAAEEAARAKGQFLANVSHELRTPINGVVGLTDLLARTELTAKQLQYVETIRGSGDALLTVVNDVLDFSKMEAGKLELQAVDFDPSAIAHATSDLLALQAHGKGLEIVCDVSADVPHTVVGDPFRLQQILTNLLANAVKFTPQGEVVLRVLHLAGAQGEAHLRFEVRDTGIGIEPEHVDRLFKAFSQIDDSNSRRYGGTGLGLAIVKQLASLMNGEVGVESTPGEGSTFWFTARLRAPISTTPPAMAPHFLRAHRVLLVDDSATNRMVLRSQLARWFGLVGEAPDATVALQMLHTARTEGRPYSLVVTDMQMPTVDGLAFTQNIRRDPSLAAIKVVMLTSVGLGDTSAVPGVDACLSKPVRANQLLACLVEALSAATGVVAADGAPSRPRLLVVEDNVINQQVIGEMLDVLGYEVDLAVDGVEGLEALRRGSYAAVLMDCQMPRMDGYEATRRHRAREEGRRVPIIAVTAHAMVSDRERALASGMDDHLPKPITLETLATTLAKWAPIGVRQRRLASTPPRSAPAVLVPREAVQSHPAPDPVLDAGVKRSARVIDLVLAQIGPSVAHIEDARRRGSEPLLRGAAHKLKGTCLSIGAGRLASLCHAIEMGRWDAELPSLLRDEAAAVRTALEAERAQPSRPEAR